MQFLNGAVSSTNLEADVVWAVGRCHWFTLNTRNRIFSKPLGGTPLCKASANAPTGPKPQQQEHGDLSQRDGEDKRGLDTCWGWSGRVESRNPVGWLRAPVLPFFGCFPRGVGMGTHDRMHSGWFV